MDYVKIQEFTEKYDTVKIQMKVFLCLLLCKGEKPLGYPSPYKKKKMST